MIQAGNTEIYVSMCIERKSLGATGRSLIFLILNFSFPLFTTTIPIPSLTARMNEMNYPMWSGTGRRTLKYSYKVLALPLRQCVGLFESGLVLAPSIYCKL